MLIPSGMFRVERLGRYDLKYNAASQCVTIKNYESALNFKKKTGKGEKNSRKLPKTVRNRSKTI